MTLEESIHLGDYGVLFNLDDDLYAPFPYVPRELDEQNYLYQQTVNYCVCMTDSSDEIYRFQDLGTTFRWLVREQHQDHVVLAHCGGKFDFQLLYEHFLSPEVLRQGRSEDPLMKGQKITSATLPYNIRLLDSYNFVSRPLSALPKIFGFDDQKGDFPHLFNLPEYQDYEGSIPAIEWYDPNTKSEGKRKELLEWHADQVRNRVSFNFREEMDRYCVGDVRILKTAMMAFRELFMDLKRPDNEGVDVSIAVDPFQYMTIAAVAYDGVYRRYFLPEDTVMIVPRPGRDLYSTLQIAWIQDRMQKTGENIRTATNGVRQGAGEYVVAGKYKVDGYCEETRTAYEFHGCYWHGCPRCYEPTRRCEIRTRSYRDPKTGDIKEKAVLMGELHTNTCLKTDKLRALGYTVVEMWECDWLEKCKRMEMDPRGITPEIYLDPLVPREAYFGGRVNCTKLLYHCTGTERIFYQDVTSMYPAVMCQHSFPVGVPEVKTRFGRGPDDHNFLPLDQLFGLQKCRVRPPVGLYLGVLPHRDAKTRKITFPLTVLTGTWTHVELQLAVERGYAVEEVYVQHHFPRTSDTLFKEYIDVFFGIKQQASLDGNKGLAEIAKMCINSPTGKWGFNPSKQRRTRTVTDEATLFGYLLGQYTKVSVNVINEDVALVNLAENDELTVHRGSNVYIAAYITAYARVKLYREALIPCDRRVLYFDTDSVMYVSPDGQPIIPIDTTKTLGLWTDEAPPGDHFTDFVASGPKSYALKTKSGKTIAKSKGFYLHHDNAKIYHFDSIERQVVARCRGEGVDPLVLHQNEKVMIRFLFQIRVRRFGGKAMHMPYDKRIILAPHDLYPKYIETIPVGHRFAPMYHRLNQKIVTLYRMFNDRKLPDPARSQILSFIFYDQPFFNVLLVA